MLGGSETPAIFRRDPAGELKAGPASASEPTPPLPAGPPPGGGAGGGAMAGVVVLIQHVLLDIVRWTAWSGGPRERDRDGGGAARGALTLVVLLIVMVFAI